MRSVNVCATPSMCMCPSVSARAMQCAMRAKSMRMRKACIFTEECVRFRQVRSINKNKCICTLMRVELVFGFYVCLFLVFDSFVDSIDMTMYFILGDFYKFRATPIENFCLFIYFHISLFLFLRFIHLIVMIHVLYFISQPSYGWAMVYQNKRETFSHIIRIFIGPMCAILAFDFNKVNDNGASECNTNAIRFSKVDHHKAVCAHYTNS